MFLLVAIGGWIGQRGVGGRAALLMGGTPVSGLWHLSWQEQSEACGSPACV